MRRWITLTLVVIGVVVGSKLLFEDALGLTSDALVAAWLKNAGTGSAMLIVALLASDIVLPIPSSLVMVLSGAAFGVAWGALLALTGSILGEWLGFELVRKYGREFAARFVGEDEFVRVSRVLERYGALGVVVTRPLPVVMETMSVIAGLSPMSRATFLLASLVGTGPIVIVYAYAGAASVRLGSLVPAIVILIAVAAAGWLSYRAWLVPAGSDQP